MQHIYHPWYILDCTCYLPFSCLSQSLLLITCYCNHTIWLPFVELYFASKMASHHWMWYFKIMCDRCQIMILWFSVFALFILPLFCVIHNRTKQGTTDFIQTTGCKISIRIISLSLADDNTFWLCMIPFFLCRFFLSISSNTSWKQRGWKMQLHLKQNHNCGGASTLSGTVDYMWFVCTL